MPYPDISALPTDPAALGRSIVSRFESDRSNPATTFAFAGTVLQAGASPALRAAVFRLVATLPGITSLGPMIDHVGRQGVAVGAPVRDGRQQQMIFDPATSAVLEVRSVVTDPAVILAEESHASKSFAMQHYVKGQLSRYTDYLVSGVVDSDTAQPPKATPTTSQQPAFILPDGTYAVVTRGEATVAPPPSDAPPQQQAGPLISALVSQARQQLGLRPSESVKSATEQDAVDEATATLMGPDGEFTIKRQLLVNAVPISAVMAGGGSSYRRDSHGNVLLNEVSGHVTKVAAGGPDGSFVTIDATGTAMTVEQLLQAAVRLLDLTPAPRDGGSMVCGLAPYRCQITPSSNLPPGP
jgi:hypothetical protein